MNPHVYPVWLLNPDMPWTQEVRDLEERTARAGGQLVVLVEECPFVLRGLRADGFRVEEITTITGWPQGPLAVLGITAPRGAV